MEKIQYSLDATLGTESTKSTPLKRAMAVFQIGCWHFQVLLIVSLRMNQCFVIP